MPYQLRRFRSIVPAALLSRDRRGWCLLGCGRLDRARFAKRVGWHAAAFAASVLVLACGGTDPSPPRQKMDETYWALALNHHAVLLSTTAPWDTLSLTAVPLNYRGDTLQGLSAPQYSSSDVKHVTVTPDGVLHAIDVMGDGVEAIVTARLAVKNVTHVDTVYVRVSATSNPPPVLANFSIHPLPPDSAKIAAGGLPFYSVILTPPLAARSADPSGNSIPNLPVTIQSSDSGIAYFDRRNNVIDTRQPGVVTFYASTTAFGVTKADTLAYRIGWPVRAVISVQRIAPLGAGTDSVAVFSPSEITVGTGAYIDWRNLIGQADFDVTFAEAQLQQVVDPSTLSSVVSFFPAVCEYFEADCSAGNIEFGPTQKSLALRGFTAPGIYEYHSVALGISGRVIVVDER